MTEIKIPAVGESINEVTLLKWLKNDGDYVERDEVLAELESEKASFEVNAEKAGTLHTIGKEGETLKIGDLVAQIDEAAVRPAGKAEEKKANAPAAQAQPGQANNQPPSSPKGADSLNAGGNAVRATPLAATMLTDNKLDASSITPSGFGGKIRKTDVLDALAHPGRIPGKELFSRSERRDKMSNLRKTVSRRLVEAKNTTAMLTTFNEVDMSSILSLRSRFKDKFKEKHGVGLGL